MRALLVVNPAATTTSARTRDVLIHALASEMKLEAVTTEYRGHARDLGRQAAEGGEIDLVVALGGDGTVNEVVNGLLHNGPDPDRLPRLAVVPGGSTNVFARALGLPNDAVEATGALLDALRDRQRAHGRPRPRRGHPGHGGRGASRPRWFTFCAGLRLRRGRGRPGRTAARARQALDARPVRAPGGAPVPRRSRTAGTARSRWSAPAQDPVDRSGAVHSLQHLSVDLPGQSPGVRVPEGLVRHRPRRARTLNRCRPPRWPGTAPSCSLRPPSADPHGKHAVSLHDLTDFTLHSKVPLPFQMDGDHLGLRTSVTFTGVRRALRVIV